MPTKNGKKYGRQDYDWDMIKADYVANPDMSIRGIEQKYGINHRTVQLRSKADNWFATKQEFQKKVREKAMAKLATKKANELAGLVDASDYIEKAILKAFSDPDYFRKHILTDNMTERETTLDILNTKAMKDMMRVIKDVEDVKRSIMDIKRADVATKLEIERERLALEKERLALERERCALRSGNMDADEDRYGVVMMPEVLSNE